MVIYAKERGLLPDCEIAEPLARLLAELEGSGGVTLVFEKGDYYIDAEKCVKTAAYITNTVGDDEWKAGEKPHTARAAMRLFNLENFTLDGGGTRFIARGKCTYALIEDCRGITLKNLTFTSENPDMHELQVVRSTRFFTDFEHDGIFERTKSGHAFIGKGYTALLRGARFSWWNAHISKDDTDRVKRDLHPLAVSRVKITGRNSIRAFYPLGRRFNEGDIFYVFDNRRDNNGIALSRCRDVVIEDLAQDFNYGLAFVAQDCENIRLSRLDFAPKDRLIASAADFLHICSCRGKVDISDSVFEGAGDDTLNVHGVHFKIVSKSDGGVTVRFMHGQTHGFNPLRAGDKIEFVDTKTLLPKGEAVIKGSKLKNEFEIELKTDNVRCEIGDAVEDVSACPDLYFGRNRLNRIITRGALVTTRGKVVIEDNEFLNTYMHSLLFSDDAESWWESGRVQDVTIRGNLFAECPMYNICIMPENKAHAGAVHKNFVVENNKFFSYPFGGAYIKSTENVEFRGNSVKIDFPLTLKDAEKVDFRPENNTVL